MLYLAAVVGGRQHHRRHASRVLVRLQTLQDRHPAHVGKIEIQQQEKRPVRTDFATTVRTQEVGESVRPGLDPHDLVVDPRTRMFFSISRAWPGSSSTMTIVAGSPPLPKLLFPASAVPRLRGAGAGDQR